MELARFAFNFIAPENTMCRSSNIVKKHSLCNVSKSKVPISFCFTLKA